MQQQPTIAVVIPAYNEEAAIQGIVERVRRVFSSGDIVVIDDGSTDNTAGVAVAAGARVLRHPYNKGNGAAVKTALRSLDTDKIVIIDADEQHPPEMIPQLIEKLADHDLVVAARTSQSDSLFHRQVGNWLLCRLASYLSDVNIPDLTSGFRSLDRRKALQFLHLYPNGFSFPATSTLAFISAGYSVTYQPVIFNRRKAGTLSKVRPLQDGLRFGILILRICTMINPLRIFLPVGLATFLGGIAWVVRNLILYGGRFGGLSLAGILLLTVGLNIVFFGIVVDQLATLRLQGRQENE